jgi:predicted O-methyltransferase YrrM
LLSRIAADLREATRQDDSASGTGGKGIILELGTSLGITTLALALAAPERRVVTVEGCPALAAIARANLLRHGAANTEVLNMEFSEALDMLKREGKEVPMAFIDGNHRGEALISYAECIRTMGEEMIIVADDIHMNRDMYSAWRSLAAPATLETFRLGILFCLRSLTPGRYRVRY